jgi:LysR family transcriptional activator of nhaA
LFFTLHANSATGYLAMSRLNYHHLHYFWHVANEGNMTRVAKQLHVSASALSAQIRQLEEAMEVTLFERQGRSLVLTEAGRQALHYANEIFTTGEELEALLRRGLDPQQQRLRIGVLSTMSRNFIETFITPLMRQRQVAFSLHTHGFHELMEGLSNHRFDIVLSNINISDNAQLSGQDSSLWHSQLLAQQPISVVGPAQQKPSSTFPRGYQSFSWVLPSSPSEIRSAFEGFCRLNQLEPQVLAEASDMAMLRLLARDSGALAVLPRVVVRDEIQQGLLVEYMTLPNLFEYFYAITIKRQYMPSIVNELMSQPLQERLMNEQP